MICRSRRERRAHFAQLCPIRILARSEEQHSQDKAVSCSKSIERNGYHRRLRDTWRTASHTQQTMIE